MFSLSNALLNTVPTDFFSSCVFSFLLLFIYFSIFAGTTSSLWTFIFLQNRTYRKENNMEAYQTTRINQSRWWNWGFDTCFVFSISGVCVFTSDCTSIVGKWFIIVHGNYVECSHFLSIHCYFEKDHHDFILWLVMLITFIYIERTTTEKKKKNERKRRLRLNRYLDFIYL